MDKKLVNVSQNQKKKVSRKNWINKVLKIRWVERIKWMYKVG